jgi:hypothetical protein
MTDHHSEYLARTIGALPPEGHKPVDELLDQPAEVVGDHEAPRSEDGGRSQGGHARAGAGAQDFSRGGSRHSGQTGSLPPDLTRHVSAARRRSPERRRDGRMVAGVLSAE